MGRKLIKITRHSRASRQDTLMVAGQLHFDPERCPAPVSLKVETLYGVELVFGFMSFWLRSVETKDSFVSIVHANHRSISNEFFPPMVSRLNAVEMAHITTVKVIHYYPATEIQSARRILGSM